MKFGLAFASSIAIEHDSALEICRRAEAAGFESVWGGEHVILPTTIESTYPYTADGKIPAEPDTPIPDPLIWLAFAAAAAPTMRLGTCILIVPQRNPLILAKELATLDRLSGGKVELGLGVGWIEEEFDALGVPWERRGARNDEYIEAMRALWAGPHVEFHGEFVDFPPVTCSPRPVQPIDPDPRRRRHRGRDPSGGTNRRRLLSRRRRHRPTRRADRACAHGGRGRRARSRPASRSTRCSPITWRIPLPASRSSLELGVGRIMIPAFFFAGPGGLDRLDEFGET